MSRLLLLSGLFLTVAWIYAPVAGATMGMAPGGHNQGAEFPPPPEPVTGSPQKSDVHSGFTYTCDPVGGRCPVTYTFTADAGLAIYSLRWFVGGQSPSTSASFSQGFRNPGMESVTLRVTDGNWRSDSTQVVYSKLAVPSGDEMAPIASLEGIRSMIARHPTRSNFIFGSVEDNYMLWYEGFCQWQCRPGPSKPQYYGYSVDERDRTYPWDTCSAAPPSIPNITVHYAPYLMLRLVLRTVNAGDTDIVVFQTAALGSPTLTYEWKKDGNDISGDTHFTIEAHPVLPYL